MTSIEASERVVPSVFSSNDLSLDDFVVAQKQLIAVSDQSNFQRDKSFIRGNLSNAVKLLSTDHQVV